MAKNWNKNSNNDERLENNYDYFMSYNSSEKNAVRNRRTNKASHKKYKGQYSD